MGLQRVSLQVWCLLVSTACWHCRSGAVVRPFICAGEIERVWLRVVGVVSLLVRVSRGEMSLGVRIRAHTQAALQAQLEAQQAKAQVPVPQAQDHGGPSIMEWFKRMLPPSFKEESDPLLAESWMREIEKIFLAIRCTEDDKVTLATYMLQERADVWWSSLLRTRFEDGAVEIGWDEFEALSTACRQEGEMEQYLEEKKASQKRPAAPFQSQVPSQRSPSGQKECPHCGRAHGGTECWKLTGKCLKCGSSEHRINDCPRLQQGGQRGAAPAPAAAATTAPVTG
ncbi:hypothetical protein Taro_051693 [Colocasia esculenta]|uniref:CCHC-type domain-containing protein n=1 Tax=Colocasia esculenta TaxID=4460 RepID=A0A843XGK8_COLES|nr:hypothetical protein [Colocasia esculenta]